MERIMQHHAQQIVSRLRAYDLAGKTGSDEKRQSANVIKMGMSKNDEINLGRIKLRQDWQIFS
jgi:hypothetical protein